MRAAWNQPDGSASVRMSNLDCNRVIAAGSSVTGLGFNASYTGANARPASFTLNGQARTVA